MEELNLKNPPREIIKIVRAIADLPKKNIGTPSDLFNICATTMHVIATNSQMGCDDQDPDNIVKQLIFLCDSLKEMLVAVEEKGMAELTGKTEEEINKQMTDYLKSIGLDEKGNEPEPPIINIKEHKKYTFAPGTPVTN